ncbi:AAA family ATPase [Deinococcus hopiensis]|uniref:AAA domain-containing protein n=1 Tax=Deinococcus hopiensis KR-140 TaxID=695939 RepID=A0A1W1VLX5_9DEIO|nr:AAA family ATPase [Deinococcus hopiensis]SMB94051.1 AAA domain-containing protein [Deinococcus hopiensis KR-140]
MGRSEPAIHALHGFLGSGKTTLARQLECGLPGMRFTSDEWMVALYSRDPPAELFPVYFARVMAVMEGQWTRALRLGVPVILDHGFWTRQERDDLRAKAAALGVPLILYTLDLPGGEALRRIRSRNGEAGALFIADETYWLLRARFQPLEPGEEAVSVTPGPPR